MGALLANSRSGRSTSVWVEALHEFGAVDRAVYEAVAQTPTGRLDEPMRRLSERSETSRGWFGSARRPRGAGRQKPGDGPRSRSRLDRRDVRHGQPRDQEYSPPPAAGPREARARSPSAMCRCRSRRRSLPATPRRRSPSRTRSAAPAGSCHSHENAGPRRGVLAVHTGVHYQSVSVGSIIGAGTGAVVGRRSTTCRSHHADHRAPEGPEGLRQAHSCPSSAASASSSVPA